MRAAKKGRDFMDHNLAKAWNNGRVTHSSQTRTPLPADLVAEIAECGFYPQLVCDTIAGGLGGAEVQGHLVHHEATFAGHEVQRHMTVLVLTEKQLLICHTDDGDNGVPGRALTTAEVVALRAVDSVVVTRSIANPETFPARDAQLVETWLTLVWGAARRLDIGPAACEDPDCDADHGFTGMQVPNDLTLRMSPAGDGDHNTSRLLEFGALLQRRIS